MADDSLLPFSFPSVRGKTDAAAFNGGRLSSDVGVLPLAMADHRLGFADRLARRFPDRRDPARIVGMDRGSIFETGRGALTGTRYAAADRIVIGLPHLSRFKLFGRNSGFESEFAKRIGVA